MTYHCQVGLCLGNPIRSWTFLVFLLPCRHLHMLAALTRPWQVHVACHMVHVCTACVYVANNQPWLTGVCDLPCAAGCNVHMHMHAGDTRPTPSLDALAKGTDVFILQNMGPIRDLDALSYESKLLIQVRAPLQTAAIRPTLLTTA